MSYISTAWELNPEVVRIQKLTKTKLGYPHTRSERIAEVKKLIETLGNDSTGITCCKCILDVLNRNTDSEYYNRITLLHQLFKDANSEVPQMDWIKWDALLIDLTDLRGKISVELEIEIDNITRMAYSWGFGADLNERSHKVINELKKYQTQ